MACCTSCRSRCPNGKCKAHRCPLNCQQLQYCQCCCRYYTPQRQLTQVITDSNGRFLDRCVPCENFPWSNYLYENWLCSSTCKNVCGKRHPALYKNKLPSAFKKKPRKNYSATLPCDEDGRIKESADVEEFTYTDIQSCRQFQKFRKQRLPVIWIYGNPQGEKGLSIRAKFCEELATILGFKYLNLDREVQEWVDVLFSQSSLDELLKNSPVVKRLGNMCVQLIADEELHLNFAGAMELLKSLVMLCHEKATKLGQPCIKGFVLDSFPCSKEEAHAFEDLFYPMVLGLYFKSEARSSNAGAPGQERLPKEVPYKYFKRDNNYDYSEEDVEKVVDSFGSRSLKILNMEHLGEEETRELMGVITQTLRIGGDGSVPITMKCGNVRCDCLGRAPDAIPMVYECHPKSKSQEGLKEDELVTTNTKLLASLLGVDSSVVLSSSKLLEYLTGMQSSELSVVEITSDESVNLPIYEGKKEEEPAAPAPVESLKGKSRKSVTMEGDIGRKVKSESKMKIKSESKTKVKSESKMKIKSESKTKVKSESKMKIKSESKTKVKSESKMKIKSESKTNVKSQSKKKLKPDSRTKLESESKMTMGEESKTKLEGDAGKKAARRKSEKEIAKKVEDVHVASRKSMISTKSIEDKEEKDNDKEKKAENDSFWAGLFESIGDLFEFG